MHRLVLASQSPRRFQLLTDAGYEFTVTSSQISEIPDENLNLTDQVRQLALDKALAVVDQGKVLKNMGNLVLSADTVVVLEGVMLGKPANLRENEEFLRKLSGKVHQVITGVCLFDVDSGRTVVDHDTSDVLFRNLSDREILDYVQSGDGLDKAGGYGVQNSAKLFVEKLMGAFDNVMGLPVELVNRMLKENGWYVDRK